MITEYFQNIEFAQPWLLGLLVILPFLIYREYSKTYNNSASVTISSTSAPGLDSFKSRMRRLPFILRMLTMICLIIALAKPQVRNETSNAEGEGIDIVLALDVSGSMTAQDLQPNRLEAAKKVAIDFINKRPTDRIGIVIFSGESFTQCPLTTDHPVLISAVENIRNGLLQDGTAIGSGLGTAVDRVRGGSSKSKIVVLLTDGENNGGLIDPQTAKEIAKSFGVKVYTIGVGTDGTAPQPVNTGAGIVMRTQKVSIDEKLLTEIATHTGGRYYRAKDNESLKEIYDNIDQLEKSKVEITTSVRYADRFFPLLLAALFFLLLEMIFRYFVFKTIP